MGRWKTVRDVNPRDKSTIEINVWLLREGIRKIDIARSLSVDSTAVTHYLRGRSTGTKVRNWLAKKGCPVELLDGLKEKYRRNVEARNLKLETCKDKSLSKKTARPSNQT